MKILVIYYLMHMNAYIKLHLMLNLKQQMLLQMVMAMDLLNEMGDNALPFFFIFLLSFRKIGYFNILNLPHRAPSYSHLYRWGPMGRDKDICLSKAQGNASPTMRNFKELTKAIKERNE
jgi:hypothetical protein